MEDGVASDIGICQGRLGPGGRLVASDEWMG